MPYEFKTKPFDHQRRAFDESWAASYYALLMEMGTGKTKVAIDTMGALYEAGKIDTALIVAPKGVYDNWVRGEIPIHLPDRIARKVTRWSPKTTKSYHDELRELIYERFEGLKVFVMNVEAFSTKKGVGVAATYLEKNPESIIIVDESTTIKNKGAARTRNLINVGKLARYKRIMTGSPVTKSPMDLYSQCLFLSPKALGYNSYFAFQAATPTFGAGRWATKASKRLLATAAWMS